MILLLNGAFGIGKSTVARSIVRQRPETVVVNPEWIGVALQQARKWAGRPVSDFQDLPQWRRWTVSAVRVASWRRQAVLVPMAFDNITYLTEVRGCLEHAGLPVYHVCLVAPERVVHERLRQRGADTERDAWQYRRASECCAVHGLPGFATHVDATERPPAQIAMEVLRAWDGAGALNAT